MVQLVMEDDRKCYIASVVSEDNLSEGFSAHVYNSKTATWNIMCSGYVNGVNSELLFENGVSYVFYYATEMLFDLRHCAAIGSLHAVSAYSVAKDCVFVLHESAMLWTT